MVLKNKARLGSIGGLSIWATQNAKDRRIALCCREITLFIIRSLPGDSRGKIPCRRAWKGHIHHQGNVLR